MIALCYREYAAPDDPVDNAFLGALLRWGWRARLARPAREEFLYTVLLVQL